MSDQVSVSVIVPVYNVEKYLVRCLDSIAAQSLREIEVICVDDGSTDRSPAILDDYTRKDPRFKILHQQNRYAGTARNLGMSKARGKYLVFWDSDDFFKKDALKKLFRQCEKDQADIAVCGALKYDMALNRSYRDDGYLVTKMVPKRLPFSRKDIPGHIFNFASNVPWNKMYLRSFVENNHLYFQDTRQANDVFFVLTSMFHAERITIVDEPLINYRINSGIGLTSAVGSTPYCQSQAFEAAWNKLSGDPSFSEANAQSFLNKMVGTLFYAWRMLGSGALAEELFDYYKNSFFPRFGIFERPRSFWYSDLACQRIDLMKNGRCTDLMLHEIRYYYNHYDALASYTGTVSRLAGLHDSAPVRSFRRIKKALRR